MSKEAKGDAKAEQEIIDQINVMWSTARKQLEELRTAVSSHAELGKAKVQLDLLERERTEKLRALGEATRQQFGAAKDAPVGMRAALEAVRAVEQKLEKQRSQIADILQEGEAAAVQKASERKKAPRK